MRLPTWFHKILHRIGMDNLSNREFRAFLAHRRRAERNGTMRDV